MSCRNTHEYLLSPVNAQAHVKRNRSELPLRSKTNPRIICDLTLDQVPLSLTEVRLIVVYIKPKLKISMLL